MSKYYEFEIDLIKTIRAKQTVTVTVKAESLEEAEELLNDYDGNDLEQFADVDAWDSDDYYWQETVDIDDVWSSGTEYSESQDNTINERE